MQTQRKGFSLIEMILVLAIIFTLGTLGLRFGMKFFEANKADRAAADMIIIQHALEQYKARYGDYPREQDSYDGLDIHQYLFNALSGKFLPDGTPVAEKAFLNTVALELATKNFPNPSNSDSVENHIMDPWGNPYVYRYRNGTSDTTWKVFGYVLYSNGADGVDGGIAADGKIDKTLDNNIDNIYAL